MRPSPAFSPSFPERPPSPLARRRGLAGGSALAGLLALGIAGVGAGLAGCGSLTRLSAEPPPNVELAGTWKLDPAHSTDSRKALHDLLKASRRGSRAGRYGPSGGPGARASGAGSRDVDDLLSGLGGGASDFPPDIALQRSLLAGGDWLRIEQRPDELVITNADSSRSFVPGQRSVVSVPSGVADQRTGWKGREYRIILNPQVGPGATETFKLSDDGRQLVETIEVGGEGRVPRLEVKRVYLPSHGALPSQVPSGD